MVELLRWPERKEDACGVAVLKSPVSSASGFDYGW
jgi:hypothetical protein